MYYFKDKNANICHAKEIIQISENLYYDEIWNAVNKTQYIPEDQHPYFKMTNNPNHPYTNVEFVKATTIDALKYYSWKCNPELLCALNFASYRNPGGMFLQGSMAQEESLCHTSTLYSILSDPDIVEKFYKPHCKERLNNYLYNSDMLFTPNVIVYDGDINFRCNIITCAAPNAKAAKRWKAVSPKECAAAMRDRINAVVNVAIQFNQKILILGAFGCGVFANDLKETSISFRDAMYQYSGYFDKVVFAVPDDKSYNIMKEIILPKEN